MKIVLGAHQYPPDNSAGVELLVQRVARSLVGRGHAVEVVCVGSIDADGPLQARVETRDGVLVHRLDLKLTGGQWPLGVRYRDDAVGAWFADYLRTARPDVFHSHSSYLLSASPLEAAVRLRVPTVVTLHDYWFDCPRIVKLRANQDLCDGPVDAGTCSWCLMTEQRRFRAIDPLAKTLGAYTPRPAGAHFPPRWPVDSALETELAERAAYLDGVLRSVDQTLTPGQLTRDLLIARGIPPERVRLARNGLDFSQWRGVERKPAAGRLRVGYLGQLAPFKGVEVPIEAVHRLASAGVSVDLEILGDTRAFPAYVARLERLAAGNPAIRFRGRYDHARIEEILADLDVLVVPSRWFEVSPQVIKEAFASGVPVVASRLPNLQYDVRDEIDGLLFAPGDATELAARLRRLVDEPDLLPRLRQGIVPPRSIDDDVSDLIAIYQNVVGRSKVIPG